ncbi:unnamed protein product, partial [Staurois parvus]
KRPPASIACARSLGFCVTTIGARCVRRTQWNTNHCKGPLCPISDHMNNSKQDVTS